ncbi:hypothetical protein FHS85_001223 [Rhodoligotrophos appendicifer]|uniref:hypothetical protein n=1 Tax=Rhodoligotrophos appendicifer TaxID=987056 RepID=UPI0011868A51|nr:hypothetical protein [Rhodoligotrophos appendicifer]
MRVGTLCLLLLFASLPAAAQELVVPSVTDPVPPRTASSAEGFAPRGWQVEFQRQGDLNRDGIADLVVILRDRAAANILPNPDGLGEDPLDTNPRLLVIGFGTGAGTYALAVSNHSLIPRREDPVVSDPLTVPEGVGIERGVLRITLDFFMSAGGWGMSTTTYRFRYQNDRFEMIGYDRTEIQRNTGETDTISINYSTGKAKHSIGSIENDKEKVTWRTVPKRPLLTLEEIGDGLEFDPKM